LIRLLDIDLWRPDHFGENLSGVLSGSRINNTYATAIAVIA